MTNIMALYKWLDLAVSGIRFGPDRAAVRAELQAHIEDRTADFMRIFPDMEEREAQERALAAMGDAEELRVSLAKVHRPWPGYLWRATRWLVWTALALALFVALTRSGDLLREQSYQRAIVRQSLAVGRTLYEDGVPDWEGERLAVYSVKGEARLGRSVISVSNAARWQEPKGDRLYLRLRITWDRPWEVNTFALSCLWAEDDLGNTYEISSARAWLSGWRWRQRDLAIEAVPRSAKELRIHHTLRDGLDLAVDLTGEVAP